MSDLRPAITTALAAFSSGPLRNAALGLFQALAYQSERTLSINSVEDLKSSLDPNAFLQDENAHLSKWKSVHLLFQITKSELALSKNELGLALDSPFELTRSGKIIESYIFFALDLHPREDGLPHSRDVLGTITRALNRLVPQPVLVLFRHGGSISLAIINRRKNMKDGTRDVLTRVSLIRDIDCLQPHRAHLDLLRRFSLHCLGEESGAIHTFADLDNAWQKLLSTQELNKRFYRELVDWFTWTKTEIKLARLPDHIEDSTRNRELATQQFTVRLICRTLFSWFLKEMGLIPPQLLELYDAADQRRVFAPGDYDPSGNHYYRGILQNIFFQALNRPMDQRRKSGAEAASDRTVADAALRKLAYLGKNQLSPDFDYDLFDRIPYLNGGLFDALPEDNASDTIEDGAIHIPNKLFYATREDGFTIEVGGKKKTRRPVEGLNRIFDRYRFTVAENTPLEEDVALDPELLGLVFENLLAEIDDTDEAAANSARKASGSFYTPRRIVDYMVNEALHLHLRTQFENQKSTLGDLQLLSRLCYGVGAAADFAPIASRVVDTLEAVRILDPACGSGAFPMGMLHRMVELLTCVDPDNELWISRLLARLPSAMRADARRGMEGKSYNYLRKLGLIQKNLYGLDIQPLAALIAKLRFFLTLVIEQEVHPTDRAHNYGLQALPNLETNFLCCDSLNELRIGTDLFDTQAIDAYITARDEFYNAQLSREQRDAVSLRIAETLHDLMPQFSEQALGLKRIPDPATSRQQNIANLGRWFRHASIPAPFYSTRAFFPEIGDGGFHIVVGNPPYGGTKIPDEVKTALTLGSKDPYGAFIARFLGTRQGPLAEGGVLAYIVSDTFMTIKTHRPLREQLLKHRLHKLIRVSGDTFHATVNCAVLLAQRGAASAEQICLMADLTNVSIHDQYERFVHLLTQTEGTGQMSRRQNISNQTYALYHYRQSLISTNSNLPFFVASPKLFTLMNDTSAPVNHETIGGKRVPVRTVQLNGKNVLLVKLGDVAEVKHGLTTGATRSVIYKDAHEGGTYPIADQALVLSEAEMARLTTDEKRNGFQPSRFEGKKLVLYDKGGQSDAGEGWMPRYHVPSGYYIDWSRDSVDWMKTLPGFRHDGRDFYFHCGITFSHTGIYSPTFRFSTGGIFDTAGSCLFTSHASSEEMLGILNSRVLLLSLKSFVNHTVNTAEDPLKELPILTEFSKEIGNLVASISTTQRTNPRYDYASNEQLEIDRLVYAAYGLNAGDIREVEDWYARRYPKLADAQKKNLAAKQGKSLAQLTPTTTLHLYCDESRHLPHDREPFMLLGLVSCPADQVRAYHLELRALCRKHSLTDKYEMKWTHVRPGKLAFYQAVLEWFFTKEDLTFRALILPDKTKVFERLPEDSQDMAYYRLYSQLLRSAMEPEASYRAFIDQKDTRGGQKVRELEELMRRHTDESATTTVLGLQQIQSHEARLLQLTDVLMGAVGAAIRQQPLPAAKQSLIDQLSESIGCPLTSDTITSTTKLVTATYRDIDNLLL
jgi:Protein of unknown function (DUF3800)